MKPLFTIHGGEYLAGSHIEKNFKNANVWVPSRDTGIDLLVTDTENKRTVSLQVKFGKDWLVTHMTREFQTPLRACGWWTINQGKLQKSQADFWVFVLIGFAARTKDFVIVPTEELRKRLKSIHGSNKMIQSYLWVTNSERCWETRGLRRSEQLRIANGSYQQKPRDFTKWLNNWSPLEKRLWP
jgi:hypothetical protein